MDSFLEDFSRTKAEQVDRCRRQKISFDQKKKFWIEQVCIDSSIIIYGFRFKVGLAFSVKVAMFVSKKWLNIGISVAFVCSFSNKHGTIKIHTPIYP